MTEPGSNLRAIQLALQSNDPGFTRSIVEQKTTKQLSKEVIQSNYQNSIRCMNSQCGKKPEVGVKFKSCGVCKIFHYCSVECQKAHWKLHKSQCTTYSSKSRYKTLGLAKAIIQKELYDMIVEQAKSACREQKTTFNNLLVRVYLDDLGFEPEDMFRFLKEYIEPIKRGNKPIKLSFEMMQEQPEETQVQFKESTKNDKCAFALVVWDGQIGCCSIMTINKKKRKITGC